MIDFQVVYEGFCLVAFVFFLLHIPFNIHVTYIIHISENPETINMM